MEINGTAERIRLMENEKAVEIMQQLEPAFFKAADLACEMQSKAQESRKTQGTSHEISIVTDADLAVQEEILKALLRTDLAKCRIIAEENTPSVAEFRGESDLYLTLDPIDGTSHYVAGRPYFATIVGLRTNTELLYTFYHYPLFGWTQIMKGNEYKATGEPPKEPNLPKNTDKSVVYSFGDNLIGENDPVAQAIKEQGLQVITRKELAPDAFIGSTALFAAGYSAGIYSPNPLCVDGLTALHFAQTHNMPIYSKGPNGELDFSLVTESPTGSFHPGYYVALRNPASQTG